MAVAIDIEALSKHFGKQTAVSDINLNVPEGSVYAFLGQNGAGKTTTIRLILGLLRPTEGRVRVWGRDVARERIAASRDIGSLVETPALYDRLTGRENLEVTRRMLGAAPSETDRVLGIVDLKDVAGRLVGGYSLGMRQRLGLARAMLGRPRLMILDEPVNGLDPQGIREMRELIKALPKSDNVTVFISSHLLDEVEQVATHVGLMHEGRLLEQSSLEQLLHSEAHTVHVTVSDEDRAAAILREIGHRAEVSGAGQISIDIPRESDGEKLAAEVNRTLIHHDLSVSSLSFSKPSLEQVYLRLTSGAKGRHQ